VSTPGQEALREHVVKLLEWEDAHISFDAAAAGWPYELQGVRPEGAPHSGWELIEHMRIAQWDILEFCRNPKHVSPAWPDDYWPAAPAPPNQQEWDLSLQYILRYRAEMIMLLNDPEADLLAPIPHGDGQTLLREALLLAGHNAYHTGQLVLVRRLLGAWEEG